MTKNKGSNEEKNRRRASKYDLEEIKKHLEDAMKSIKKDIED